MLQPATACARCGGRGSTSTSLLRHGGHALRAATVLSSSHATYGVTHLASLARLLPERDPHEDIYEMLERTLTIRRCQPGRRPSHQFRTGDVAELGFGLDLENCAARRDFRSDLRVAESGGAVSRRAGEPFRDRLLRLPPFCAKARAVERLSDQDLQDGFRLTGLFLLRHVLEPRQQGHSDARDGFSMR